MAAIEEIVQRLLIAMVASVVIGCQSPVVERRFVPATEPQQPFRCAQTWRAAASEDAMPYVLPVCKFGINREMAKAVFESTVAIEADTGKQTQLGAGAVIGSEGAVLTAAHVVAGAHALRASSRELSSDGLSLRAVTTRRMRLFAIDTRDDLAVIVPEDMVCVDWAAPLVTCPRTVSRGEVLWHFGMRTAWSVADVLDPDLRFYGHRWFSLQTGVFWGDSGGPVVDGLGRVVGVLVALDRVRPQTDLGYAVRLTATAAIFKGVALLPRCK